MFPEVWDNLPNNVSPKRSLADSAYFGNDCLAAARRHGAVPLHGIKKNARHFPRPETHYQKMVSFWQHWPNRAAALYGKRNHAETAFSMIGGCSDIGSDAGQKQAGKMRSKQRSQCSIYCYWLGKRLVYRISFAPESIMNKSFAGPQNYLRVSEGLPR